MADFKYSSTSPSSSPSTNYSLNPNIATLFIGIALLFIIRWLLRNRTKKHYHLPPGPTPFPIVGNLPQFFRVKKFFEEILELCQVYGGIFKIRIGSDMTVFVSDLDIVKEGLITKGEALQGRPNWMFIFKKLFGNKGLLLSSGSTWKKMRKFTLSSLRTFAFGKKSLEEKIYEETEEISRVLQAHQGKPFSLKAPLGNAVMNIIYGIVFGQRLEYTHPRFQEIVEMFEFFFKNAGVHLAENFFPWIHNIRWNSPAHIMIRNDAILQEYVHEKIQEHRESFDANNIRDFIDMYILMAQDEKNDTFSEVDIFRTIMDLFIAASETTATSLLWAFLYTTKYPEVQGRCRDEIKQLTGFSRMVTMADKDELPFVNATILEVQRMAPISAFIPPHVAEEDVTLGNFDIPKGTIVHYVAKAIHSDPKYWKDPEEFLPGRWLTDDMKLIKHEAFLPFSWGIRNCIGEPIARMEMFLFFTNLLQRFEFTDPPDEPVSVSAQITGLTYHPVKTLICAKPL